MEIKTGTVLKDYENQPIKNGEKDLTLGVALSVILTNAEEGGKMKLYVLAEKAYKEKSIDVDAADLALIKRVSEASRAWSNLVIGQILLLLDRVVEKDSK